MGITVREALSIPPLGCSDVIAGISGLDRVIGGLTVMEAPDSTTWMRGGELVLTIGYMYRENPHLLCPLIEELDKRDGSGLGIKFNRFISDFPLAAKLKADQLGFPVIAIPYELGWMDIFNGLYKYLLNEEAMKKYHSNEVSARFMDALLKNQELSSLLEILCYLIQCPVAIIDTRDNIMLTAYPPQETSTHKYLSNKEQSIKHVTYPLSLPSGMTAYLAVYSSVPLTALDAISIEHCTNAVSLYLAKEQAVKEVERRYRTQFITSIINGQFDSVDTLIERARDFGWNFSIPHVVALIEVNSLYQPGNISYHSNSYLQQKEQVLEVIRNGFYKQYTRDQLVAVDYGRHILVVVLDKDATLSPEHFLDKIKSIIQQAIEDLQRLISPSTLSSGISRVHKLISDLHTSYEEAKQTLSFVQTMRYINSVMSFDELGVYKLIGTVSEKELRDFTKEYLEPLISIENKDRLDSLKTLRTYLQYGGAISNSAEALFIDRRTMRYRLDKIEKMLELDLKDPINMLNLSVAIMALDMLQQIE